MVNVIKKSIPIAFPLTVIAIVTYGSLLPSDNIPSGSWLSSIPNVDKIIHFIFYFATITALRTSMTLYGKWNLKNKFIAVVCAIIYGGLIEILQGSFFNRSCDLWDFTANALGALSAGFFVPQRIFNVLIKNVNKSVIRITIKK